MAFFDGNSDDDDDDSDECEWEHHTVDDSEPDIKGGSLMLEAGGEADQEFSGEIIDAILQSGKALNLIGQLHRQRVYASLVQQHSPALAETDLVMFHNRSKKVEAEDGSNWIAALVMAIDSMCRNEGRH